MKFSLRGLPCRPLRGIETKVSVAQRSLGHGDHNCLCTGSYLYFPQMKGAELFGDADKKSVVLFDEWGDPIRWLNTVVGNRVLVE